VEPLVILQQTELLILVVVVVAVKEHRVTVVLA
jgi:hypothetical protein